MTNIKIRDFMNYIFIIDKLIPKILNTFLHFLLLIEILSGRQDEVILRCSSYLKRLKYLKLFPIPIPPHGNRFPESSTISMAPALIKRPSRAI